MSEASRPAAPMEVDNPPTATPNQLAAIEGGTSTPRIHSNRVGFDMDGSDTDDHRKGSATEYEVARHLGMIDYTKTSCSVTRSNAC